MKIKTAQRQSFLSFVNSGPLRQLSCYLFNNYLLWFEAVCINFISSPFPFPLSHFPPPKKKESRREIQSTVGRASHHYCVLGSNRSQLLLKFPSLDCTCLSVSLKCKLSRLKPFWSFVIFFSCVTVYFVNFDKDFHDENVEIQRTKCGYLDEFHGTDNLHHKWRYETHLD